MQVAEDAVTDRVVEAATSLAAKHGLAARPAEAEEVPHPGGVGEVRAAAVALAVDTAGVAGALTARMVRLRRPPPMLIAALTLLREDPRLRSVLSSALSKTTADLVLAAASAAVYSVDQSPTELVLDAVLRASQLAEAVARVVAFDAAHDQLCVPERVSSASTAPVRRPAPVDPLGDYAVKAITGSVVGAVATLLLRRNLQEASTAVLAGSPKPARYGWAAYQTGLGCALAWEAVLVRDGERLRLLQVVDTVVMHSSALSVQGHEPDPLAEAVVDAARQAGLRVVVVGDSAVGDHVGLADEIVGSDRSMSQVVSALQDDGHVVLTIARLSTRRQQDDLHAVTDPEVVAGLLRGDLAVTLADEGSAVLWAADLVCVRGLVGVWRLLQAVPAARKAGQHATTYAQAAAALSGLLVITGGQRRWANLLSPLPRISPVNLAAAAALLSGWGFALGVATTTAPTPRPQILWHALTPEEVLRRLFNDSPQAPDPRSGLAEHRRRLVRTASRLPGAASIKLSLQLADAVRVELNDPLTPILAVGAGASAILGSTVDAGLVLGAMGVNAVVGGVQRLRAERALASLTATQQQKARRVRTARNESEAHKGTEVIDAAQLARGDVIELDVGDVVPADARLLDLSDLEIDESALTGESLPVAKQVPAASSSASIADRRCMVFEGTTVVAGQARAVVVDTGEHTETGRAVTLASRTPPAAGVQARLRELTSKALPLTLAGGATVTALSLLYGRPIRQAISGGVAVAVAAVPEGLPLVATVAQMAAARRLSRRGILVRTARTLEALGRVDTMCFDKTGTLTHNRLRVVRVATVDGMVHSPTEPEASAVLQTAARACPHDGRQSGEHSHATDDAVLAAAPPDPDWAQVSGQPFETNRGYAAATGTTGTTALLAVKGAPEVILACCPAAEPTLATVAANLAGDGLRVLAVAQRRIEPSHPHEAVDEFVGDLEFLGFLALADTPRPSSALLVTGLRDRGVNPVMLTGDHPDTALAIATTLGWPENTNVVTGPELAALDRAGRARLLRDAGVIARVAPEQKLQVIEALRAASRVVAMVGDGANDAAAIRAADVGIGIAARGSAAARNAADLVLTDADLTVLLEAVTEGRALWRSVADAISILLGGNAGEVGFTVLGTLLTGDSPLSTRQLLLVNLLTDMFPAMAVAVTPTDDHHACHGTGPVGTAMLDEPLTRQIRHRGILTGLGATTAWLMGTLTPGSARRTSTMALCGLVGAQLTQTLVGRYRSPLVLATSLGSATVLVGIVQTPGLSHFFGCTPLGPVAWAGVSAAIALGFLSVVFDETALERVTWWVPGITQLRRNYANSFTFGI